MPVVKLSSKGQIVIPADIRKKYGLRPGSRVEIFDMEGQIVLCSIPEDPIEAAHGFLSSRRSISEMLKEAREEEKKFEERKAGRFR
ncbi:MAG: AbrB/MazE/SpoVT family DNA-binding domain-containing protein [Candidatus Hydrothermarchaeota archaeon]|nr:MAG: AbrB/MazE/SpoVT family DNA-binding domain-containing protein [Candidatus Hydrothermarchaeota archaeon]